MSSTVDFFVGIAGTDSSPNTVPPADDRLFNAPFPPPKGLSVGRSKVSMWIEDGTSADVDLWARTASGKWTLIDSVSIAAPSTLVASTKTMPPGVTLFAQITAVVGATALYGSFTVA